MTDQTISIPMSRSHERFLLSHFPNIMTSLLLLGAWVLIPGPAKGAEMEKLVVLPFEIVDNIPAPGSIERNEAMLDKLTEHVAKNIRERGLYEVVPQSRVEAAVSAARLGTYIHSCNQCDIELAREAGGDKVMIGWIYKMSLLILTLHVELKDVASGDTIISKAYDFRGDNEYAWMRAAEYMARDLEAMTAR